MCMCHSEGAPPQLNSSPAHLQASLQAELAVLVLELIDEQHLMHLQAQGLAWRTEPAM